MTPGTENINHRPLNSETGQVQQVQGRVKSFPWLSTGTSQTRAVALSTRPAPTQQASSHPSQTDSILISADLASKASAAQFNSPVLGNEPF